MDDGFDTVREVFERCLELAPDARRTLLSGQPERVRRRVEAMLAADAQPVPLLDGFAGHATQLLTTPAQDALPTRVGEFEVLRELGRGGMGAVYLARQHSPERLVAIKRLAGAATAEALDRFRREANLLARLQHPGIAAIHGLGQDADGQPFIVMEYIEGGTLRQHARPLPVEERLRLLAAVCDAVDHAHQRGVIHRDLKPGNVLVTPTGQPKVLDFGIARLVDPDVEAHSLTATGVLLGTPAFMSPEQASGRIDLVGPASDVYALAAIGYELLTDRLPVSVSGMSPLQAMRAIAEETPAPLSRIVPALRGDLELIFATALAKDPAARYASAAAFGDDLRRYLARETIRARRPSLAYRAMLFARRKPALVASFLLAVIALVGGSAAATWFALGQRAERMRAEAALAAAQDERARAESTLRFLTTLLAEANPARSGRPDAAVKDVLDRALPRVESLPEQARAPLLLVLADALAGFGAGARVTPLYEQARDLAERHGDRATADLATAHYGAHLFELGRLREARAALGALASRGGLTLDPGQRQLALAFLGRTHAQLGEVEAARRLREQLASEPAAPPAPGEVPAEMQLAAEELRVLADLDDYPALIPLHRDLTGRATALLGESHPFVLNLRQWDIAILFEERRDDEGIQAAKDYYQSHRDVLGVDHPATLRAKAWLANYYAILGLAESALRLTEETLDQARTVLPHDSVAQLELVTIAHGILSANGQVERANTMAGEVHDRFCNEPEALPEWCGLLASRIAEDEARLERPESAAVWLKRAQDFLARRLGPDHLYIALSYIGAARGEATGGRAERALAYAAAAEEFLARQPGAPRSLVAQARMMLAFTYVRLRRFDLAAPHAESTYYASLEGGLGAPIIVAGARVQTLTLAGLGRFEDAERVALDAWRRVQSMHIQDQGEIARTLHKLYLEAGRQGEAKQWLGTLDDLLAAGGELAQRDQDTWKALNALRAAEPARAERARRVAETATAR